MASVVPPRLDCVKFTEFCPIYDLKSCISACETPGQPAVQQCNLYRFCGFAGDSINYNITVNSKQLITGRFAVRLAFNITNTTNSPILGPSLVEINYYVGNNLFGTSYIVVSSESGNEIAPSETKSYSGIGELSSLANCNNSQQLSYFTVTIPAENSGTNLPIVYRYDIPQGSTLCDIAECVCTISQSDLFIKFNGTLYPRNQQTFPSDPHIPLTFPKVVQIGNGVDCIENQNETDIIELVAVVDPERCGNTICEKRQDFNLIVRCSTPKITISVNNDLTVTDNWCVCKSAELIVPIEDDALCVYDENYWRLTGCNQCNPIVPDSWPTPLPSLGIYIFDRDELCVFLSGGSCLIPNNNFNELLRTMINKLLATKLSILKSNIMCQSVLDFVDQVDIFLSLIQNAMLDQSIGPNTPNNYFNFDLMIDPFAVEPNTGLSIVSAINGLSTILTANTTLCNLRVCPNGTGYCTNTTNQLIKYTLKLDNEQTSKSCKNIIITPSLEGECIPLYIKQYVARVLTSGGVQIGEDIIFDYDGNGSFTPPFVSLPSDLIQEGETITVELTWYRNNYNIETCQNTFDSLVTYTDTFTSDIVLEANINYRTTTIISESLDNCTTLYLPSCPIMNSCDQYILNHTKLVFSNSNTNESLTIFACDEVSQGVTLNQYLTNITNSMGSNFNDITPKGEDGLGLYDLATLTYVVNVSPECIEVCNKVIVTNTNEGNIICGQQLYTNNTNSSSKICIDVVPSSNLSKTMNQIPSEDTINKRKLSPIIINTKRATIKNDKLVDTKKIKYTPNKLSKNTTVTNNKTISSTEVASTKNKVITPVVSTNKPKSILNKMVKK